MVKRFINISTSLPFLLKNRMYHKKRFFFIQEKHICNQHTPLHIYNATKYSKKSMNHRLFYINWMFVFLLLDFCNGHLDI
ncbi:hypothetical protein PGSY75_1325700 [Plasmodium gaboni]|uniref:Uncharacterized protein n=1 Tax=Plasmodium gaboni TaxID=647221 RepID=A0A151LDJ9_9APIC|nr:hypothetical protein PGSY75_1325700 [Plasmodium gaboni]XP_028539935.1 conserved Plasmodium protein, unknown function [Plasmodium sp. gorilla clade G2]KYN97054.1 hypothetical protein PGSY75_1325700 [Plasmodium gaboni]SOV17524.1 conserved Plasmodium protein, unknown function [Plasmodium gaboni]SOV17787.1 conserved Plasmodium protein, unknown function [Plasmodium sp. gorilla clade G2]